MTGKPFSAAEAQQLGLVDIVVQTSANAYSEVEATINRLKSTQPQLLHTCKTVFPMLSVEEALVTMGARAVKGWTNEVELEDNLVLTDFGEAEGSVVLTLNNPKQYNELDLPLTSALTAAIENIQKCIDHDTSIKAVILAGAGKHFCVGVKHTNDSSLVMAMNDWNFARPPAAALMHWFAEALTAIRRVSVPVLAILHGHLIGGAVAMALNTDWRVATANASFQHGNLKRGMNPIAQFSQSLPRLAGCLILFLCYHVYCALWSF